MANLKDIGKFLVGRGLPFIGSLLAGKTGEALGETIAGVLGVENKPDAIMAAIEKDPNAAVKLKELETQLALAQIDRDKAEIAHDTSSEAQAAETIRVEASSSDEYVRRTRPKIIRAMFYLTAAEAVAAMGLALFGSTEQITAAKPMLMELFTATSLLMGTGLTGYTLARMREKNTAANPQPGALQALLGGLRK